MNKFDNKYTHYLREENPISLQSIYKSIIEERQEKAHSKKIEEFTQKTVTKNIENTVQKATKKALNDCFK